MPTHSIILSCQRQLAEVASFFFCFTLHYFVCFLSNTVVYIGKAVGNVIAVTFANIRTRMGRLIYESHAKLDDTHCVLLEDVFEVLKVTLVCFARIRNQLGQTRPQLFHLAMHSYFLCGVSRVFHYQAVFFRRRKQSIRTSVPLAPSIGVGKLWLCRRARSTFIWAEPWHKNAKIALRDNLMLGRDADALG